MAWRERDMQDGDIPWWEEPDVPYGATPPDPYAGVQWTPGMVADMADSEHQLPLGPLTGTNTNNNTPPPTGGKTRAQIEAEGREYDARNGLVGGYMNGDVWVSGSPRSGGGGGGGGGPRAEAGGFAGAGFRGWPSYAQPAFDDPGAFDPGPAFSFRDFVAPTGESITNDPGFQFRMDQGRKALEASRAGRGVLNSGETGRALTEYGQNFGSQEYGNVWNRALQEYDTNRNNAFDQWGSQYGQRKDAFGFKADRSNNLNSFNTNNAQFDFSGRQRQAEQEFQDLYNRWLSEGNWTRDLALGGLD